eukprot:g24003.t1
MDQYSMKAFANALDVVPMALAENSGLQGIAEMAKLKAVQENTGNAWHGVDCMQTGTTDMWEQNIYEACASKSSQLRLATQVVKMILKIDDVITSGDVIDEVQLSDMLKADETRNCTLEGGFGRRVLAFLIVVLTCCDPAFLSPPRPQARPRRTGLRAFRDELDDFPWPKETMEVMIDGHSLIECLFGEDLNLVHDKFTFWPARLLKATELLTRRFGLDRPPSPWSPIIAVFDLPDPGNTWNGAQVKRYKSLRAERPDRAKELCEAEVSSMDADAIDASADDGKSVCTKRTVSALILPPQRQDSVTSIHSIMEVVRERVGALQGTIAGGLLNASEADDWKWRGSPKTTHFSQEQTENGPSLALAMVNKWASCRDVVKLSLS